MSINELTVEELVIDAMQQLKAPTKVIDIFAYICDNYYVCKRRRASLKSSINQSVRTLRLKGIVTYASMGAKKYGYRYKLVHS